MSDPRELKLPLWVQQRIHNLRTRERVLTQQLESAQQQLNSDKSGSAIVLSTDHGEQGLGSEGMVSFKLPGGEIDCAIQDGWLYVSTVGRLAVLTESREGIFVQTQPSKSTP